MNIELKNTLDGLLIAATEGKNPVPFELLEKQIEILNELLEHTKHIRTTISNSVKQRQIENESAELVLYDNINLITETKMRIEYYEKMLYLFVV